MHCGCLILALLVKLLMARSDETLVCVRRWVTSWHLTLQEVLAERVWMERDVSRQQTQFDEASASQSRLMASLSELEKTQARSMCYYCYYYSVSTSNRLIGRVIFRQVATATCKMLLMLQTQLRKALDTQHERTARAKLQAEKHWLKLRWMCADVCAYKKHTGLPSMRCTPVARRAVAHARH